MSPRDSAVRIGLVYPDLLGTYGDRGNAVVLVQRCALARHPRRARRGAGRVEPIPDSLDVYLFGGGEDDPQHMAAEGMRASKANIERAHAGGAVVLAVCAGFQLVGHRYIAADGAVLEGIGLVDLETARRVPPAHRRGRRRADAVVAVGPAGAPATLTGFENHGGRTTLGPEVDPLGRVLAGGGNGDGSGLRRRARRSGSSARTCTDPVLPRNPQLADRLLSWVTDGLARARRGARARASTTRAATPGSARGLRKWWQDRMLARG